MESALTLPCTCQYIIAGVRVGGIWIKFREYNSSVLHVLLMVMGRFLLFATCLVESTREITLVCYMLWLQSKRDTLVYLLHFVDSEGKITLVYL